MDALVSRIDAILLDLRALTPVRDPCDHMIDAIQEDATFALLRLATTGATGDFCYKRRHRPLKCH